MKELFIRFLEKADAYEDFLSELSKLDRTIQYAIDQEPASYIIGAFIWHSSLKGTNFWMNLDYRWKDILEQYGKENK